MASEQGTRDTPRIPVEPRNAASLVLLRDGAAGPEVLVGRRPMGSRFMPGVYVFPGGAVDGTDFALETDRPLADHVEARLRRQAPRPLARALAWTAIRETWEETGLLIGTPGRAAGEESCPAVQAFSTAGLAPDLRALDYLMRAVTPPYVPIRFNTRFFIADASAAQGPLRPCPELEDVGWRPIDEVLTLSVVNVTEYVLDAAKKYWLDRPTPDPMRRTPMFTQYHPGDVVLREE
jgi:8-oxo-dGTP pyrophosphatase MutT (NUDIX family)